jgi:hypothetical protein
MIFSIDDRQVISNSLTFGNLPFRFTPMIVRRHFMCRSGRSKGETADFSLEILKSAVSLSEYAFRSSSSLKIFSYRRLYFVRLLSQL